MDADSDADVKADAHVGGSVTALPGLRPGELKRNANLLSPSIEIVGN